MFQTQQLPLTFEQFHRLPRNSAYKYEFVGGHAWLSPRPRWFHALLDLHSFAPPLTDELPAGVSCRPLCEDDWGLLAPVFAAAFHSVQPFGGLDGANREVAARHCLGQSRSGGDGPLIHRACFVAVNGPKQRLGGAVVVTLVPSGDLSDVDHPWHWEASPPPQAVELRLGQPHLTWVFVSPFEAGQGVATALLARAVGGLLELDYLDLASTFLLGNDASTLWHWRNGFRLLGHPCSGRELRKRWK
jgi:hypothetical protein